MSVIAPDPDGQPVAVVAWYDRMAPIRDPDWSKLPDGLQVVMVWYANGTNRQLAGWDWFFTAPGPGGPIYGGTNDRRDLDAYRGAVVVRGRWTDDATYRALVIRSTSELPEG